MPWSWPLILALFFQSLPPCTTRPLTPPLTCSFSRSRRARPRLPLLPRACYILDACPQGVCARARAHAYRKMMWTPLSDSITGDMPPIGVASVAFSKAGCIGGRGVGVSDEGCRRSREGRGQWRRGVGGERGRKKASQPKGLHDFCRCSQRDADKKQTRETLAAAKMSFSLL